MWWCLDFYGAKPIEGKQRTKGLFLISVIWLIKHFSKFKRKIKQKSMKITGVQGQVDNDTWEEMRYKNFTLVRNSKMRLIEKMGSSPKKYDGCYGRCCVYSSGRCLPRVVSSGLHWISMWIKDRPSSQPLHMGLDDLLSRWECGTSVALPRKPMCVVCVWIGCV